MSRGATGGLVALAARYAERSLRERLLLLGAAVALAFGACDQLLMQPLAAREQRLHSELDAQRQVLAQGRQRLLSLLRDSDGETAQSDPAQRGVAALREELEALDAQLRRASSALMPPREMPGMLEQLLAEQPGLRLTALTSLPPERQPDPPHAADAVGVGTGAVERPPAVFRHAFALHFEGDYHATLRYLRALQALPWRLHCRLLEYRSENHPRASVTLELFTLSLSEDWIGI